MKVIFTEEARLDLLAIGDYIAEDNPRRAWTFLNELRARCVSIGDFPEASPLLSRHEGTSIRRAVHGNYAIFYVVGLETVNVLRVLNSSINYERFLFEED
ncbi:plasmid stabilization system protein ParE [Phyllobacterium trifolii]|uniref:Plasmid stabilization system protein ParE n=1 Tax=Phyllobacterium trifolii TaxID=300193 RepID=A0A839UI19_9HYPH|nr:type II toxin-antitoxin system RelE/ParE family toxin [Phyllobacterium trifolii]MBB3148281.1 plasmid stabilization system protein ParE [Phyllobacterium trifolii]